MKAYVLIMLMLFSGSCSADSFFAEQDKQKHMALSAVGSNLLYASGLTKLQAFSIMLAIGAIKEAGDDNSGTEHARDMLANAIGASSVFVWEIKF